MDRTFTSHQFVLLLAQANQRLYIEALWAYREDPDPFREVHLILSRRLREFGAVLTFAGEVSDKNIFGHDSTCASWQKV